MVINTSACKLVICGMSGFDADFVLTARNPGTHLLECLVPQLDLPARKRDFAQAQSQARAGRGLSQVQQATGSTFLVVNFPCLEMLRSPFWGNLRKALLFFGHTSEPIWLIRQLCFCQPRKTQTIPEGPKDAGRLRRLSVQDMSKWKSLGSFREPSLRGPTT